ncbi:hypothetical protein C1J03_18145 [Sulfitobacter sp. SK012]|uniref:hypothetical protein n=1 Tax=Sulfitobacter sp. SK012 TaxID=1389005 RepID=UPI000E0A36F6|nr:hypothetical protein [Sulfitobacter sp. SK012]AXI47757.1 hypothetical protein C1J03_18145 [Sulfitobacter sp. SK012]
MNDTQQIGTGWQQHGITPVLAFQVFGMRRSGNHAIIDWMMRNAPVTATGGLFYNNCRPRADPTKHFASVDVSGSDRKVISSRDMELADRMQSAGDGPMVLVSYEDMIPRQESKPQQASRGFSSDDFSREVLIYRSFLNWSASMLAKLKRNASLGATQRMRVMFNSLRTYIDGLDLLAQPHVVGLCYDDWMQSEAARADMLARLGLPVVDNARGQVQRFGGGSSFQNKVSAPEDLNTTSRTEEMSDDIEYQMLLWTTAHDAAFVERLIPHFPKDAERLVQLAEQSNINVTLPKLEDVSSSV